MRPIEEKIQLAQQFSLRVLPLLEEKKIVPVVDTVFTMTDIAQAHLHMEGNQNFGKIVAMW